MYRVNPMLRQHTVAVKSRVPKDPLMYREGPELVTLGAAPRLVVVMMIDGTGAVGDPFNVVMKVAVGIPKLIVEVVLVEDPLDSPKVLRVVVVTLAWLVIVISVKVAVWADTSETMLAGMGAMVNPLLWHMLLQKSVSWYGCLSQSSQLVKNISATIRRSN